ncbi:MAG: hypothetical protein ACTTIC_06860 [Helicobacteraceae bacterium]
MSEWKDIWNSREARVQRYLLEALIKADGYDTASGAISVDSWLESAKDIMERLEIKNGASVYEIGCGSGALLYAMQMQDPSMVAGGGGQTLHSHLSTLHARF